jgi:prephenate dehydrogenase
VGHVALVGTGLIGGSIGLALTRAGREVIAVDAQPEQAARAVEMGAATAVAATMTDAAVGAGDRAGDGDRARSFRLCWTVVNWSDL